MAKQRFGINDAYRGTVGTVIGYEWRGRWCLRAKPLRVRNPRTVKQQNNRLLFKQMVRLASSMKMVLRKGLRKRSLEQHMTECNQFVKYNKECFSLDAGRMPAVQGEEPKMVVDWERLIISDGSVAVPVFSAPDTLLSQPQAAASSLSFAPLRSQAMSPTESGRGEQIASSNPSPKSMVSGSSPKLGEVDARRANGGVCKIVVPFASHAEGERASGDDEVYLYAYCPELGEGVLSVPAYRKKGCVSIDIPERWNGNAVHLYGFAVDYVGNASATTYIGQLEAAPVETPHAVPQIDAKTRTPVVCRKFRPRVPLPDA